MAPVQTFFLDRLASLILELHSLSFYSLRAEDLYRFSSELNDFSIVGFDMSPFRARLDLLSSTFQIVALRSEVTMYQCENNSFSEQLSDLENTTNEWRPNFKVSSQISKLFRS